MFMRKHARSQDTQSLSFSNAQLYPFTAKVTKGGGEIKCNTKSFDGTDPSPGHSKQCFCALEKTLKPELVAAVQNFWSLKAKASQMEASHEALELAAQVADQLASDASEVSHATEA